MEPYYLGLRDAVLAQIESGTLTEDMRLSSVLDSLDTVQLIIDIEELGIEPAVSIKSVGDLLWLFKAIDLKRGIRAATQTPKCLTSRIT
jgi:hypothetical protein